MLLPYRGTIFQIHENKIFCGAKTNSDTYGRDDCVYRRCRWYRYLCFFRHQLHELVHGDVYPSFRRTDVANGLW